MLGTYQIRNSYFRYIMAFQLEITEEAAILTLTGDVNIASNAELRAALDKAPKTTDLIVHSKALDYIDSSGIACLISAYSVRAKTGAKVFLKNPSDALLRVLDTLKFATLFPVLDQ